MRATRLESADAFLARASAFLLAHEAEYNLPLGLLGRLRTEPRLYGHDPVYVIVEDGGSVEGCLVRTPPHGAIVTRFGDPAVADALAKAVLDQHPGLPGVVGPTAEASRFAEAWSRLTGAEGRVAIRQRIHAAGAVHELPGAPGRMRPAEPGDEAQVVEWLQAFAEEALGEAVHVEDAAATYHRREGDPDGGWVVWDDGSPVSLAAFGSPTPHGQRIGPVYTPPELRGRGYATSLVGGLTGQLLGAGWQFCFLFTDLANPTSNAIYARIGYAPVADWDQWLLGPLQE